MIKKIKTAIKITVYLFIDLMSSLKKAKEVKEVILVRLDAIGDFIIWQDAAKEIKKMYPEYKITLVCNSIYRDLADNLPYYDEVIPLNIQKFHKDLLYRFKFLLNLKSKNYLKAISPVYSRTFFLSDWIIKNIRAKEKIGFDGDLSNISNKMINISNFWYTKLITSSPGIKMEIIRNAEFIRGLGNQEFKGSISDLKNDIKILKEDSVEIVGKYIVFFIGASNLKRCWEMKKFAEVINNISEEYKVVILGVEKERELLEEIILGVKRPDLLLNLIGKTSLIQSLKIISNSKAIFGNESAGVHMSATLGIPSITILGGGHFGRFLPYQQEKNSNGIEPIGITSENKSCFNCNWQCVYPIEKNWKCISDVKTIEVIEILNNLLTTKENEL